MQATPLHFAVINRQLKNVELLIHLGCDVNAVDKEQRTPLHIAVIRLCTTIQSEEQLDDELLFFEYKMIIKELLFHGASRLIKTKEDKTALDIFTEHRASFSSE